MPFDAIVTDATLIRDLRYLRLARSFISVPNLWCKQTMQDGQRRCMVGALRHAMWLLRGDFDTTEARLEQYLPAGWQRHDMTSIVKFNDAPTTQHSDVLAVYDRAIDDISNRLGVP